MEWTDLSELLIRAAQIHAQQWGQIPAPHDTLPSADLDAAVDACCEWMAGNYLDLPDETPLPCQPWVLARLAAGAARATELAAQGDPQSRTPRDALEHLLVAEWHRVQRDRWPLLMRLPEV